MLYHVFAAQGIETAQLMHMALATSLASIIVTAASSTYAHHRQQAVQWKLVSLLTPGIILGAWLGASFATTLDTRTLKPLFAIFEFSVAISMIMNFRTRKTADIKLKKGMMAGLFIGFISSIVGIGGGTLTVPILHWYKISMRFAVATAAACGLPIALLGSSAYIYHGWEQAFPDTLTLGYINLDALVPIVFFSMLTAPPGARLAHNIPEKMLKNLFAVFLLLLSIKMLVD